jgi:hypothetical protein
VVVAVTTGAANTQASSLPKTGPIAKIVNEVVAAAEGAFSHGLDMVLLISGTLMLLSGLFATGLVRKWRAGNLDE